MFIQAKQKYSLIISYGIFINFFLKNKCFFKENDIDDQTGLIHLENTRLQTLFIRGSGQIL